MEAQFSPRLRDVIAFSREEAIRLGHNAVGTEHLLLGIIRDGDGYAVKILGLMGVDLNDLRFAIEEVVKNGSQKPLSILTAIPLTKQAEKVLKITHLEVRLFKSEIIGTEHLLLAILRGEENVASQILARFNVTYALFRDELLTNKRMPTAGISSEPPMGGENEKANLGNEDDANNQPTKKPLDNKTSKTPVLDNFGRDLTKMAEEGKLDPIVGREHEIERVSQILSRRKKNNPILIGEPGVGKSAIAEGLALRIVQRKVSRVLFNKRVVTLDLASLVAGTKYRGQFEERMKAVMNELEKSPDVIIFIDEIHTIIGAGGASGSLDVSNMVKPALARGELQCIGATTLDEYRQYIEKDGALDRRFQKVMIEPASISETIEILNRIKSKYEDHHTVSYTDEAINACVMLTNRYISDRFLPDKAIDALDEAGSRVHLTNIHVPQNIIDIEKQIEEIKIKKNLVVKSQQFEEAAKLRDTEKKLINELEKAKQDWEVETKNNRYEVSEEHIAEVVSMMTGIPVKKVSETDSKKLLNMNDVIGEKIIGQPDAIKKLAKAIQRTRAGLKDPNKPIGSFIFLGPTGVGKTELAKELARFMFDTEDSLIQIDMSEYMEKFAVTRLIGAPPGYVGHEEGGQLTEKVRRKPYSVVLLDEVEKAHPDVFNLLLQVLDEGRLTDSLGRKVDFKNTILIMTSNIGARQVKDFGQGVGFTTSAKIAQSSDHTKNVIEGALKKAFAPEFLNRIDDVIMFNGLEKEDIFKIIDIEVKSLLKRVHQLGYSFEITETTKEHIAQEGYDSNYGARPLKRAIQKIIEDPIAEEILKGHLKEGNVMNINYDTDTKEVNISIDKKKKFNPKSEPKA